MRNIDKLNELLQAVNIPSHRRSVDLNGKNLGWLRKHLRRDEVEQEVVRLVDMNNSQLAANYAEQQHEPCTSTD